jgi:hypothetical protein
MSEEQLIFIISQPRAGSTYLQGLLSNNDEVSTTSEPWLMLKLAPLFKPELCQTSYNYIQTERAYSAYADGFDGKLDLKEEVKMLALKHYDLTKGKAAFFLDKTPRYWEILDELIVIFPKAYFIVLLRNPIDVLKSMIQTWNLNDLEKLENLKRDILLAPEMLLKSCVNYQNMQNFQVVHYENLIRDKAIEVSNLYQWLNIKFDPLVLDIENNTKVRGTFGDPYQKD